MDDSLRRVVLLPPQSSQEETELTDSSSEGASCDLSTNLHHLLNPTFDYPNQVVAGPMQADEMLLIFSLVRTSFMTRVLEIGGFHGDSAYNFLEALRCKPNATVYTVDLHPVPNQNHPTVRHKTILKDAAELTLEDIDDKPIDLLLLDCHAFQAQSHIVRTVLTKHILTPHGYIVLHDTGMHRLGLKWPTIWMPRVPTPNGIVHQPVERLLADWIPLHDCSFQRISFHDDARSSPRHGLTILQRRINLDFSECKEYAKGGKLGAFWDFEPSDCDQVQAFTASQRTKCPSPQPE